MNPDTTNIIPSFLQPPPDSVMTPPQDTTDYLLLCNDSISARYEGLEQTVRPSMFTAKGNPEAEPQATLRQQQPSDDWFFAVAILLLALMSVHLNSSKFKIKDIFLSLFDLRVLDRVFRENNIKPVSLFPMSCIFAGGLSLLVIDTSAALGLHFVETGGIITFLAAFAAITLFLVLRNWLTSLLGEIFGDSMATHLYICSNYLFHFIGGLSVVPLALLAHYSQASETFLKIIIIFIAILFIVRIFRGFQLILTNSRSSKLYLFYYLCILELAPVLILGKLIIF